MPDSNSRSHLKRLADVYYEGASSYIHWTMTMDQRRSGWLTPLVHAQLREALTHSLGRHKLICPVYVFMPDHAHFLLMGYQKSSQHKPAITQFRRQWNQLLKPDFQLQHQAYENVLRESDRKCDAFQSTAYYISQNPVRSGAVTHSSDYPYWGTLVPGYPHFDPRKDNFWKSLWLTYNKLQEF